MQAPGGKKETGRGHRMREHPRLERMKMGHVSEHGVVKEKKEGEIKEKEKDRGRVGEGGETTITQNRLVNDDLQSCGRDRKHFSPTCWYPVATGTSSKLTRLMPSGSRLAL